MTERLRAVVRALLVSGLKVDRVPHEWRREADVERATLVTVGERWLANLEDNLGRVLNTPPISELAGLLSGRPALVVGSGPSRRGLLQGLGSARERFTVIATNSALRPLLRAGCVPDAVVVVEGRDCSADFDGIDPGVLSGVVLLFKASTHPAHLDRRFGARAVFLGAADAWLGDWFGPGACLPSAGNAGTAAIVVAWALGAAPVYVTGIDFAMAADESRGTIEIPGWNDETAEVIRAIRRRDPHTEFMNVTPTGARIEGMRPAEWRLERERHPATAAVDLVQAIRRVGPPSGAASTFETMIDTAAGSIERLAAGPDHPAVALALSREDSMRTSVLAALAASAPDGARAALRELAARFRGLGASTALAGVSIAFDLDGVLVDSEPFNVRAAFDAFGEHGIELEPDDVELIVGRHPADFVPQIACRVGLDEEGQRRLRRRQDEIYLGLWREGARLIDGVEQTLESLTALGARLALATSSDRSQVREVFDRFDLERFFRFSLTKDDVARRKPDPEIYLMCAREFGIESRGMCVVEDSEHGLRAAKAAGSWCVVLRNEGTPAAVTAAADAVVDGLREIPGVIVRAQRDRAQS